MKPKAKRRYGVQPPADKCNKGNPSSYDHCPQCGNGKTKSALLCRNCRFRRLAIDQPADPLFRVIPLTRGKTTLVDSIEYPTLARDRWSVTVKSKGVNGHKRFYAMRFDYKSGQRISMARQIMRFPAGDVDHINGDTLDNRRANLRVTNRHGNSANGQLRTNNTSGYKGVWWSKDSQKWAAGIRCNYKQIHLGLFETREEAALAYNAAAIKYFGEFARLNQVSSSSDSPSADSSRSADSSTSS